jgi:hypothetical protein
MITLTKLFNKQCSKLTLTVGRGRSLYARESELLLNRTKLVQATIIDKLDCGTTTGVTRAITGFPDLPLHEARGIHMEDMSGSRMSSLIDFVVPLAI